MSETQPSSFAKARTALLEHTRYVQNFPEDGVLFEDLTPVLANAEAFAAVVEAQADAARQLGAEVIGGLDARGFLLGSAVAYKLGLGVIAIRKKGKLPPPVVTEEYNLEYGSAALELPSEGLELAGKKVVLIDDVLATGGTLAAARKLIESCGGIVTGYVLAIEVGGLSGRERLGDLPVHVIRDPQ